MLSKFAYKIIYQPSVNSILRIILKPLGKLLGKPVISVSGTLKIRPFDTKVTFETNQTCFVTQELFFNNPENYEFTPFFKHVICKSNVFLMSGPILDFSQY